MAENGNGGVVVASNQQDRKKPHPNKNGKGQKRRPNKPNQQNSKNGSRPGNRNANNGPKTNNKNTGRPSNRQTLKALGLGDEDITNVLRVHSHFDGYYDFDSIVDVYREHQDVEKVIQTLTDKKSSSWSSLAQKKVVTVVSQPKKVVAQQNGVSHKQTPVAKVAPVINADEVAQKLGKSIEDQLREVKERELSLMNIKQQLDSVGDNSEQEQLVKEKALLDSRKKDLVEELEIVEKRIVEVNKLLKVAEDNRRKKVIEIEQKFSKGNDKAADANNNVKEQ